MNTREGRRFGSAGLGSALIVLCAGYARAQTPGNIPIFDQPGTGNCNAGGGNDCIDSVMVQDANGNIGIGTSTPMARLDIAAGNLNLEDSTTASGNILKAGSPFLHNAGPASTFLGLSAGNFSVTGDSNTGLGYQALSAIAGGFSNTAVGAGALSNNASGHTNTAVGRGALQANTIGVENTATGRSALYNNLSGNYNTANGVNALQSNRTGSRNVAIGHGSLFSNVSGNANVAVGADALRNATGSFNIGIGESAGYGLQGGDNNIYIGYSGGILFSESNTIRIGECRGGIFGCQHQRFFAAGVAVAPITGVPVLVNGQGQMGVMASSRRFKEDIQDMGEASASLRQLRPVTFYYKVQSGPRQLQYGLIAEEVADVNPNLVEYSENGEPFTVRYHLLAPMLLNELQRQDHVQQEPQGRLEALEAQVASLARRFSKREAAAP